MTFTRIDKPVEEDETSECVYCGVPLVAAMTNYGGRYDDYLQWQYGGKSHYQKDGGCKGNGQTTIEEPKKPGETPKVPDYTPKGPSIDEKIEHLTLRVDSMYDMVQSMFHILTDIQLGKIKVTTKPGESLDFS